MPDKTKDDDMDMTSQLSRIDAGANNSWFASLMNSISVKMHQRRIYRQTYSELQSLGDRELNDLGLSRSMIRSIAAESAAKA